MYHRIFLFPWQPNFVFIADLIYVYIQSGEYVTTVIWLWRGCAPAALGTVGRLRLGVDQLHFLPRSGSVCIAVGNGMYLMCVGGGGHHVSWFSGEFTHKLYYAVAASIKMAVQAEEAAVSNFREYLRIKTVQPNPDIGG